MSDEVSRSEVERMIDTAHSEKFFLAGMVMGAVIGGALALLFAPAKGTESRHYIQEKAGDAAHVMKSRAEDTAQKVKSKAEDTAELIKAKADNYKSRVSEVTDEVRGKVEETITKGEEALRSIKEPKEGN